MSCWEGFAETSFSFKNYNEFYLQDITSTDYTHAQKLFEDFQLENLGDYHNLHVKTYTLLLPDVFKSFRNKCIEIYEIDSAQFLSAPGLSWQACLKKAALH